MGRRGDRRRPGPPGGAVATGAGVGRHPAGQHHTAPYRPTAAESEVQLLSAAMVAGGPAFAVTKVGMPAVARPSKARSSRPEPSPGGAAAPLPKRFLLWIDGVGGYLVCLSPRVTFGQAVNDGPVDVPLFADLSRLHAEIFRDGEGYVLESAREVLVNGLAVPRTVLRPGDRLTLGTTCQFLFHLPVPISPSARLELVSGHRLPLAVDGIILMAESLVLGPGMQVARPVAAGGAGERGPLPRQGRPRGAGAGDVPGGQPPVPGPLRAAAAERGDGGHLHLRRRAGRAAVVRGQDGPRMTRISARIRRG